MLCMLCLIFWGLSGDTYAADFSSEPQNSPGAGGTALQNGAVESNTPSERSVRVSAGNQVVVALGRDSGHGWLLAGYCGAIILASLLGGWLPGILQLTHTTTQTLTSFVGGLMLGIAIFHLLPHSLHGGQSPDSAAWWMMAGILVMFLLIRCFHFHHHGPLEISTEREDPCAGHSHDHDHGSYQNEDKGHDHNSEHNRRPLLVVTADQVSTAKPHCHHAHELSWMGILIGLSLHTLLDGMALAASLHAESGHRVFLSLYGLGTFLAILLHKPLDAISITSLMRAGGWSSRARLRVNLGFSLMCPVGAVLFSMGLTSPGPQQQLLIDAALAFSAGIFLCISLSDLLPEMEFHAHNRLQLTAALLAGILLAYGIRFLEPSWMH